MPLRAKSSSSSRLPFRTSKHSRSLVKNACFSNCPFNLNLSFALPLIFALVLLFPFFSIILLFNSPSDHDLYSHSPILRNGLGPTHIQYTDPCALATPKLLLHFDPSSRTSRELEQPIAAHVDPATMPRVFASFFGLYLFDPAVDFIVNIILHGRGRSTDVQDALIHSQRALRIYFQDHSIVVTNYSLGYSHLDRVRGSRYIFHLVSSNDTNPQRRDVVALQRMFDGSCFISVREFESDIFQHPLYLVVPYSNRPARLKWFLDQFDRLRGEGASLKLILTVCKDLQDDVVTATKLISAMTSRNDVRLVEVPGDRTGFFSRAVSVREGSNAVPNNSIMFITDVDMYIFPPMFDSCRLNSIQGSQVYFPVFYSLYARSTRIDKDAGYWRDSSFGMSCMYKSDFDAVGAYDRAELAFVGWGGEDLALSQAFMNDSRYELFRAVEPALRHKWHMKDCEPFTSAYEDCVAILFQQLGTMAKVGRFLLGKNIDAQALFAEDADEDANRKHALNEGGALNEDGGLSTEKSEKLRRRREFLRVSQNLIQREREVDDKAQRPDT